MDRWILAVLLFVIMPQCIVNSAAYGDTLSPSNSLYAAETEESLILSEFMASNTTTLLDGDGDASDWIELYNPTSQAINVNGWYLTDDPNELAKWQFPLANRLDLTLQPQAYLVVFASGKEYPESDGKYIDTKSYVHTSFKLADGEGVALVKSDGQTVASAYWDYPAQRADVSYGLDAVGVIGYFSKPTPGAANSSAVLGFVKDTKFSIKRGFFTEPFELEIATETEGALVRYTLNGSEPTTANGTDYSMPIAIKGTTVLRAAAFKDGYQPSNVDTQTYLFVADVAIQSPTGAKPTAEWPNPTTSSSTGGRPGNPGGPGGPGSSGSQKMDYGMDPDVVNNARYKDVMDDALLSIPSLSIVTDLNNLFSTTTGIYMNPQQDGIAWERPISLELINPDGSEGFQVNAGLRIRGGVTRATDNPKHSFRLFFRSDYGDAKLKYALFGDEGVDEFDKMDLRTSQNFSWSYSSGANCTFLDDTFTRDSEGEMDKPYTRSRWYHLYINGQYWGMYQTEERPSADYAASYLGGDDADYDTIKADNDNGKIYAADGNLTGYQQLWTEVKNGVSDNEKYFRLQGLAADGITRVTDYPRYLDVNTLIDYMLLIYYAGNCDCPLGPPGSDSRPRNLYAVFNRTNPDGVQFITHDNEQSLGLSTGGSSGSSVNRVNVSLNTTLSQQAYFNPWWLHQQLMTGNAEYRLRFADRVQKYFFNGGVLTTEKSVERLMARKAEIDMAVIAESARWGDAQSANDPRTKDDDWIPAVNKIVNNFLNASTPRTTVVFNQIKTKGWWPALDAPVYSQQGGIVAPGFSFTIGAAAGTIYYTLNGDDPRLPGGGVNSFALEYLGESIPIAKRTTVMARAYDGTNWSAVNAAVFGVENDVKTYLRIAGIQYNPAAASDSEKAAGFDNNDDFEYIVLRNTSADQTLDLTGVRFTEGVQFDFSNGVIQTLAPGAYLLVVSNIEGFTARYGANLPVAGAFEGHLANGGERIVLVDSNDAVIHDFEYSDKDPWPEEPDGDGPWLEVVTTDGDYTDPANWQASALINGDPGEWQNTETTIEEWMVY